MKLAHHIMTFAGWADKNNIPFDLKTALKEIKDAGYEGVELGGDAQSNGPAKALQTLVRDSGLEIAAWGIGVTANRWEPAEEQAVRELDYAAELGIKTISVCGGFMPEQRRTTLDHDYELFAEAFQVPLARARQNGQTLAFHPHCGCIVETLEEVVRLFKVMPDLDLNPDTGHFIACGGDPTALVKIWPSKIRHIHLKDWNPEERKFKEIGYGTAGQDFDGFYAALDTIGYDGWVVVERDDPQVPAFESAKMSREYLRSINR